MKLSEAIRLGGMMKPQGRGSHSMISLDAPCALGSALQSIGKQPKKWRWHGPAGELWLEPTAIWAMDVVADNWPFTLRRAECPCGSHHGFCATQRTVANIIGVLNDHHRWTRNQIADWVATVEPAEEEVEQGALEEFEAVCSELRALELGECPNCHRLWGEHTQAEIVACFKALHPEEVQ